MKYVVENWTTDKAYIYASEGEAWKGFDHFKEAGHSVVKPHSDMDKLWIMSKHLWVTCNV